MQQEMKYIIVRGTNAGHEWEFPFVFPKAVLHNVMAHSVRYAQREANVAFGHVVGAGFWNPRTQTAHGRSESLDIESRTIDTSVIMCGGRMVEEDEGAAEHDAAVRAHVVAADAARPGYTTPPRYKTPKPTKAGALRNRFKGAR